MILKREKMFKCTRQEILRTRNYQNIAGFVQDIGSDLRRNNISQEKVEGGNAVQETFVWNKYVCVVSSRK